MKKAAKQNATLFNTFSNNRLARNRLAWTSVTSQAVMLRAPVMVLATLL